MTATNSGSPFADLLHALASRDGDPALGLATPSLRIDGNRARRTGIPEIVHAENKDPGTVAEALRQLSATNPRVMASRIVPDAIAAIAAELEGILEIEMYPAARAIVAARPGARRPEAGGRIGILSAGTSDVPIAAEAGLVAAEMGATVYEAWDVGVAGLHRLVAPLEQFACDEVDVIVVAAGMDGALPSVVAGLVDVPVIGLPTSIGYGLGGGGIGALLTMLQSCAPGLAVVNIDNGVGAGSTAALIANRAARLRHGTG